ncbi:MAG: hypothetical protein QNJ40_08810 [Xanthomonadales bacterium]|nr:hypothetical protein [Xanthomonadales bacterium]
MKRFTTLFLAMLGTICLTTDANAGRYRTCNGDAVVLHGDPTTRVSTISFPVGSTAREDLNNTLDHWNSMLGMHLEFDPVVNFSGNYRLGNGRNEIAAQDISGLGLTTIQLDACFWWFESQHIQEFDIEVDSNTAWDFGAPPENTNDGNNSLRYTAVHELGHALGLLDNNDSNTASVMKQSLKGESWSAGAAFSRMHPFGDDAFTARSLYPHSNGHRDIATSAFEVSQTTQNVSETMANTTIVVPNNGTFTVRGSFSNLGKTTENFDIVYVLSTNTIISTFDTVVASGTGTAPPGSFHTFSWTGRVPNSLAPGTYSLGLILDPNNNISERLEYNNVALLRTRVRVP